ncbi:alpha-glucan water dikinase, chloroplastic-like [Magnolia sinica]|uniref:alpha-glucan water dikinase, chloroplastic-like n=1 Tax=Magnolia sinica TaxID=86752 RepID=UPI002657E472|nr:alpha-glucan water dikinase, chloroplastic-like [Magnolia sinica]
MGVRLAGMHLNSAFGGGLPPGISGTNDRCTILVSNLDPGYVSGIQAFEMIAIAAINLSYLYATYINHHILPKLLCLKATSAEILYSRIEESELSDASSTNLKEDGSSPSLTLIKKQGWYSDKLSYLKGKVPSSIGIPTSVALPFGVFEKVLLDDSNLVCLISSHGT